MVLLSGGSALWRKIEMRVRNAFLSCVVHPWFCVSARQTALVEFFAFICFCLSRQLSYNWMLHGDIAKMAGCARVAPGLLQCSWGLVLTLPCLVITFNDVDLGDRLPESHILVWCVGVLLEVYVLSNLTSPLEMHSHCRPSVHVRWLKRVPFTGVVVALAFVSALWSTDSFLQKRSVWVT